MRPFLRSLSRWYARRRGAQVVVFDGAAEIEKTRAFAKGAICGVLATTAVIVMAAPTRTSPSVLEEVERRESLLKESNQRAAQAIQVADMCLATATSLERTLSAYQTFLGRGEPPGPAPVANAD
jgi:hypothetical protein